MIFLKASIPKLVEHIQKRGREYEGSISLNYLKRLNEKYEKWISGYDIGNLLIIDADETDFKSSKEDFGKIIQDIDSTLFGLF